MTSNQLTIVTKMVGTGYVERMEERSATKMWLQLVNGWVAVHFSGYASHYDKKGGWILNVSYKAMATAEYDFEAALRPSGTCVRLT